MVGVTELSDRHWQKIGIKQEHAFIASFFLQAVLSGSEHSHEWISVTDWWLHNTINSALPMKPNVRKNWKRWPSLTACTLLPVWQNLYLYLTIQYNYITSIIKYEETVPIISLVFLFKALGFSCTVAHAL